MPNQHIELDDIDVNCLIDYFLSHELIDILSYIDFSKAIYVDLNPQTLVNKNLFRAKLAGVDLRGKNLKDVILEDVDLTDVIISEQIKAQLDGQHVLGLDKAIVMFNIYSLLYDDKYKYCQEKIKNLMLPF